MGIRRGSMRGPFENVAPSLDSDMEDLSQGVEDGRVRKMPDTEGISTTKLAFSDLGEITVINVPSEFRHRLNKVPHFVMIVPRSDGRIWELARADATRIWLQSDLAGGRKARVIVFG